MDRYGNLNTTVIGPYGSPRVRLPGGGGAPEIASSCGRVFITMLHSKRRMVEEVDFVTSLGFGITGVERAALGITTQGPALVITDLCLMHPEPGTNELIVASVHSGVTRAQVADATGWNIRFSAELGETEPPTESELETLRDLQRRTDEAHREGAA
jgi:glutaconate CoA-transferase subunit B